MSSAQPTATNPRLARRSHELQTVMVKLESELSSDHFSAGFGKFREAVNLSRGFPVLEDQVTAFAVEQAKRWLPQNWRLAKSLLLEANELNGRIAAPEELWQVIRDDEREERLRLASASKAMPVKVQPAPAPTRTLSQASVTVAAKPVAARHEPAPQLKVPRWRRLHQISNDRLGRVKNLLTAAFTFLALSLAIGLLSTHYRQHPLGKRVEADNQAWSAVDPLDPNSIERYLALYPEGVNRRQAVQALVNYRLAKVANRPAVNP